MIVPTPLPSWISGTKVSGSDATGHRDPARIIGTCRAPWYRESAMMRRSRMARAEASELRIKWDWVNRPGAFDIEIRLKGCSSIPVQLAISQSGDGGRTGLKQLRRAAHDRLEHRLHVRRRARNHLENISGRGLPLQRFLGLVKQPRVLDRDHGLVGEGLEKLHVMTRKRAGRARVTAISPIAVPWFISGANSKLRKPRARAISRISPVRLSVSGICATSPACTISKGANRAIGIGKVEVNTSSASGVVGVNALSETCPSMKR